MRTHAKISMGSTSHLTASSGCFTQSAACSRALNISIGSLAGLRSDSLLARMNFRKPRLPYNAWLILIRTGVILSLGCLLTSCVSAKTPHQNFLESLEASVGRDIRRHVEFERYQRTMLPNGNFEYRLTRRYGRWAKAACTTIFEVDPDTFKVLHAGFSGSKGDCAIPL